MNKKEYFSSKDTVNIPSVTDQIFKNIFVFVDIYACICTHVLAWKLEENILLLTLSTYLFEVGFLPHPRTHSFSTRLEATKLQQFSFLCPIHSLSYRHSQNTLLVSYMGACIQTPVFMVVLQRFIITEFSVQLQIRSSLPYFLDFFLKRGIAYVILFTW